MNALASASHVILDAARMGSDFQEAVRRQSKHTCLYQGESARNLALVAPYLFEFALNSSFGEWLLETGWGRSWGVFLSSKASLDDLRLQLRKLLIVKTVGEKSLYFRFYDPRVLTIVLPALEPNQLGQMFGLVGAWFCEGGEFDPVLEFSIEEGKLCIVRHMNTTRPIHRP